jgi:hypothetical protein
MTDVPVIGVPDAPFNGGGTTRGTASAAIVPAVTSATASRAIDVQPLGFIDRPSAASQQPKSPFAYSSPTRTAPAYPSTSYSEPAYTSYTTPSMDRESEACAAVFYAVVLAIFWIIGLVLAAVLLARERSQMDGHAWEAGSSYVRTRLS